MSVASRIAARIPFGIGTVAMLAIVALVATAGAVLAVGTPTVPRNYVAGQLRSYPASPDIAWTQSSDTLPGYADQNRIEVADTRDDQWLLSYPSGIGRAFIAVDRLTGRHLWEQPLVAGLGDCGYTAAGTVGCAVKLGGVPDGFYLLDDAGRPGDRSDLNDTATVTGLGPNFLRINQSGYRVALRAPSGRELWTRTFATAARVAVDGRLVIVSTTDGAGFVLDPDTGADKFACARCTITAFPTGLTVEYSDAGDERVDTYAVVDGALATRPTSRSSGMRVLDGPSTLPVLTASGSGEVQATQGRYEVRDPARSDALWQLTDPELSKANTRPCGDQVAFALKDRSRTIYDLAEGNQVGALPPPDPERPDANLDQLNCVGSSGKLLVFANSNQLTGVDPENRRIAWTYPINGDVSVVDGYIVLTQRATLTVLRPG